MSAELSPEQLADIIREGAKADADASPAEKAILAYYKKIAREVTFNQQGSFIIPSDR